MKQAIKLIIFFVFLSVLYVVYNLATFEPEQKRKFVFNEPVMPPEMLAEQESRPQDVGLTPEEITKKDEAVRVIQAALDKYQTFEQQLPQQASPTLSVLNNYFISGALPTYFLGSIDAQTGLRKFGELTFSIVNTVIAEANKKNISCLYYPDGTETLIGSEDDNVIECDAMNKGVGEGDRLILGGPGDDKITDTYGNRIVNGGSGNDSIALGPGRSIIVLEDGWGQDQLTVDCGGSSVQEREIPPSFPVPWVYKATNFIVLSPRIDPNDLVWEGLVLKSKSGNDQLTVSENCFTIVPTMDQAAETPAPVVAP
ncbi:MAG TPA: calcium-binding protein [Alphaproteobacteria bacterium]|nr:calcium-binding protein [Alphaproteobacteria bacterium]HNS45120.1 calcium-binding protein [Alphaproteobacteria bacterium]